ncbi:RagB/SusD family nutrient uptake outer membrane protein [Flavobacterium sp. J49]|uniref:RagB/SusD family nutrient uptake outer membrane protein n=1 Tax=Flavobacterium sp. J49 TaxID=2718534 RepID=UPI0015948442|nr:RagB/SusD family nutrient uptake outer membrane protein [Flavobacterium sp. J49]MBF6640478.1 RagB/SusD family nutrient uptake outer membrane protein [Flavobacterium sp. J49]NIC01725.1 RagB/SusD family nutrient uptake outer membrane protein [Flavobacterium sp. J49]
MKSIKSLIIILGLIFSVSSCNDATDIVQDGELGNNVTFRTVSDLSQFLNGSVYSSLGNTNEIMLSASFTDECGIGPNNGGQELQLHRFNLNQSTGYVSGLWIGHYTVINRANRLIEAAELVTPVVNDVIDETAEYNSIIAEARAIRAYSYFQLLTYFSTDLSDDSALGVMLFDYVPAIDEKLPRSTNGEVFALIESDLAFADDNLINRTGASAYKYASTNMINALRARMYLYRKNYTLAKQYAQAVLDTSGLVLTPATPYVAANFYNENTTSNPYRRIWADLSQGEVLFALSRPSGGSWGNIAGGFFFNTTTATGGAFLDMGRNLFNELRQVSGDIRGLAFVDPTSLINPAYLTADDRNTTDVLVIDKYPGKPTQPLRNDIKIFRLSEMYFILAECAVAENQLGIAAGYIKNIRDARNRLGAQPLPSYADQQQAWADILKERRKEFCFEGFRYVDIKRLGVLANQSIDRNITDDLILTLPTTISNTDYRFTLPIPQDEIAGNPTIQQNPGYN